MARNYLIAIGGTGARCLEAVVYLAAAGLFKEELHVLIIDPDQNNGNSSKTRQIMTGYHALHLAKQPTKPRRTRRIAGPLDLLDPTLFQASINRQTGGNAQQTVFWHNPNSSPERRFKAVIDFQAQEPEFKDFLKLFYEDNDLEMTLDVGYRGRTNVGSVALKQDLEGTAELKDSGLNEFLINLDSDLKTADAKIFVMGSVFGGTGAAGLPTIPSLIDRLPKAVIAENSRKKIRYGCAMMSPYFSFPQRNSEEQNMGPGTDSSRHAVATQAALIHYAHVPPGYQHVYFVGAPARPQTNSSNEVGGQRQLNSPHYAEIVAALSAWDFFQKDQIKLDVTELHFADTIRTLNQTQQDLDVRWDTLPVDPDRAIRREEIRRSVVVFATFAYFFKNFLYQGFVNRFEYKETTWYRNNFGELTLDNQGTQLRHLYDFSCAYLQWLDQVGKSGSQATSHLFNWNYLLIEERALCEQYVSNLMGGMANNPKYINDKDGYDRILEKMDAIRLTQAGTDSAAGLFMYLLHRAIVDFCYENYFWKE